MAFKPIVLCAVLLAVLSVEQCVGFTLPPRTTNLIPQQSHLQQPKTITTATTTSTQQYIFGLDKLAVEQTSTEEDQISYVIERISDRPTERVFRQIAEVCINVFFKEQLDAKPEDRVPPWKEAQISYLKTLQTGDLKLRRKKYQESNEMFLAYEVLPATSTDSLNQPLILNTDEIYNLPSGQSANQDYVRGRLLGFCEVTQRPYGLGEPAEVEIYRPVLTNLAVAADARKYGIGSKLVDECERKAGLEWKMNEIVLEVEDYNDNALSFYMKRGYDIVFCDPASRRFDVGGIMLKKVRCTRQILRKRLSLKRAQLAGQDISAPSFDFFQRFRQTVGA